MTTASISAGRGSDSRRIGASIPASAQLPPSSPRATPSHVAPASSAARATSTAPCPYPSAFTTAHTCAEQPRRRALERCADRFERSRPSSAARGPPGWGQGDDGPEEVPSGTMPSSCPRRPPRAGGKVATVHDRCKPSPPCRRTHRDGLVVHDLTDRRTDRLAQLLEVPLRWGARCRPPKRAVTVRSAAGILHDEVLVLENIPTTRPSSTTGAVHPRLDQSARVAPPARRARTRRHRWS